MKETIQNGLKAVLPQRVRRAIFHLGFNLDQEEFLSFAHLYANAPHMQRGLQRLAQRGLRIRSIVDIGAFHGNWSEMAHGIWPSASITMVEANQDKEPVLSRVAERLGADLHFNLLGPEDDDPVEFFVMESGSSVFEENSPLDRRKTKLSTKTLDTLLAGKQVDLIKIDTQGFELEVLKGASKSLEAAKAVLLEISLIQINKGAPLIAEVIAFMDERGFAVCELLELHRRPLDQATNQIDLLFVPKSSDLLTDTRHFA
ncbi:MAG: FkbM family methyltransferase [Pseudomonadota bacterium]